MTISNIITWAALGGTWVALFFIVKTSIKYKDIAQRHARKLMEIAGMKGRFESSHASLIIFSRCKKEGGVWLSTQYIKIDLKDVEHDEMDEDLNQIAVDWFEYIKRCDLEIPGFH